MDQRDSLPTFNVSPEDRARAARARIQIDGLVARPLELTRDDVRRLPRGVLEEPFVCEEGWSVPGLRWGGVPLSDLVALASPLPEALYVRAGSGKWVVPIALADLSVCLVCDELNGEPLTLEHGAPWRLVVSGGACFTNVKWLDHLELARAPGEDSARTIAMNRVG